MSDEKHIQNIEPEDLVHSVRNRFEDGWRLVQIACARITDTYEITYSFDKDLLLEHLRIQISVDQEISSITSVYLAAFVYENEIADLYGIPIKGIAIDYKGKFIRTSAPHPFKGPVVVTKGGAE
jgi:ech hydrogenase subunit D